MEKIYTGCVTRPDTLQNFLRQEMGLTKNQIRQAKFREDGICVNGIRSRVTGQIAPGDRVDVRLENEHIEKAPLIPVKQLPRILYEDEDLVILDKPSGLVVHPSHGHYTDSLSNQLAYYFASQKKEVKIRSIGRLDKETSGLVVFAKNQVAAQRLSQQRESGIFSKEYTAIVHGTLSQKTGTIAAPIAPLENDLMRMCVSPLGKPAVTHYQVINQWPDLSMVRLHLDTGRTHQIRVHMHWLGHPLVGDLLYGTGEASLKRAALHAFRITLQQPFTGQTICVSSDLPEDLVQYLKDQTGDNL